MKTKKILFQHYIYGFFGTTHHNFQRLRIKENSKWSIGWFEKGEIMLLFMSFEHIFYVETFSSLIRKIFSDMINHSPLSIQSISNIWGWMNKLSILDFQLLAINQNRVQINSHTSQLLCFKPDLTRRDIIS